MMTNIDFRSKFSAIHREHSPIPRKFYGFCTSVTVRSFQDTVLPIRHIHAYMCSQDTTTTGGIIAAGASTLTTLIFSHAQESASESSERYGPQGTPSCIQTIVIAPAPADHRHVHQSTALEKLLSSHLMTVAWTHPIVSGKRPAPGPESVFRQASSAAHERQSLSSHRSCLPPCTHKPLLSGPCTLAQAETLGAPAAT